MSRLKRKMKSMHLNALATDAGWRQGKINIHQRQVHYYNGASYVRVRFSPWLYDISSVYWWDAANNRGNVFDRHDGDLLMSWLLWDIFVGKLDSSDKNAILKYVQV